MSKFPSYVTRKMVKSLCLRMPGHLATFFHKMTSIKKYHHFSFTEKHKRGKVQEFCDTEVFEHELCSRYAPNDRDQGSRS